MAVSASQLQENMAAESYVGSFITLTTKDDIRYEGFILKLDIQTSSILLRNVKSFGTEGRTGVPLVPPSERIIGCITIRTNDLKDLKVISLPGSQNSADLPDDPAIIKTDPPFPTSGFSLVTPGNLQGTIIRPDVQMGFPVPYAQGNLPLNQSMEASRTYVSFSPIPPLNIIRPPLRSYMPFLTSPPPPVFLFPDTYQQPWQFPDVSSSKLPYVNTPFALPPPVLESKHETSVYLSSKPSHDSVQGSFHNTIQKPGQSSNVKPPAGPQSALQSSCVSVPKPFISGPMEESGLKSLSLAVSSDMQAAISPPTYKSKSLFGPPSFMITSNPMMSAAEGISSSRCSLPISMHPPSSSVAVKADNEAKEGTSNTGKGQQSKNPPILRPGQSSIANQSAGPLSVLKQSLYGPMEKSGSKSVSFAVTSDMQAAISPPTYKSTPLLDPSRLKITSNPMMSAAEGTPSSRISLPRSPYSLSSSVNAKAENEAKEGGTSNTGKVRQFKNSPNLRMDEAASSFQYGNMHHTESQVYGGKSQAYWSHKGYEQEISQPLIRFTEDFDFESMHKKFNKTEIWSLFSKNNQPGAVIMEKENEILPPYQKDDFFDSISCRTHDAESGTSSKIKSSEQNKIDAETFGVQIPSRGRVIGSDGQKRCSQGS